MRQVNREELVYVLQSALRKLTPAQIAMMRDHRPAQKLQARVSAAETIATVLDRFEILSSAPKPPSFRYADLGDPSGAPPVEE